jgi:hypothetical protein
VRGVQGKKQNAEGAKEERKGRGGAVWVHGESLPGCGEGAGVQ